MAMLDRALHHWIIVSINGERFDGFVCLILIFVAVDDEEEKKEHRFAEILRLRSG